MPPPTQAQQSYGTGYRPATGMYGIRPPGMETMGPLDPSLYSLGMSFNQAVGGMPSTQVATNVEQGIPVNPNANAGGGPPNPDATTNVAGGDEGASVSPAQAGNMNALMPGTFNGNPANGVPGSEVGWQPSMATPMPTPGAPPGGEPKPLPAPAPQPEQPPVNPGMPTVQVPGDMEQMPMLGAAAGETPGVSQEPVMAPAQEMAPLSAEATAAPTTDPEDAGTPWATDTRTFEEKFGQSRPAAFNGWTAAQKAQWKANHYQPLATPAPAPSPGGGQVAPPPVDPNAPPAPPPPGAPPPPVDTSNGNTNGLQFWDEMKALGLENAHLGQLPPASNLNLTIPANVSITSLQAPTLADGSPNPYYIADGGVYGLVDRVNNWGAQLVDWASQGESIPAAQQVELRNKYDTLRRFLEANYGIKYDPAAPGNPGGPPGGNQDGTVDPTQASDMEGAANEVLAIRRLLGDNAPQWMVEFVMNLAQQNSANARYTQANQTIGNAADAFGSSPARTMATDLLSKINANPDPTPWDLVENRRIENIDRAGSQAQEELASSLNRRGLSSGAGIGSAVELQQRTGDERARAMSDTDIQKAQYGRDAEYRALGAAGDFSQLYDLGDFNARLAQANFQRGAPQAALSPLEGWGDSWLGEQALNMQSRANDLASSFTVEDILGMLIPAGGQLGSAAIMAGA